MLVAAMNPCPCGHFGNPEKACRCTPHKVEHYRSKISGPLLERIDIHLEIPMVTYQDLTETTPSEGSQPVRERVRAARRIQEKRWKAEGLRTNAEIPHRLVKKTCLLIPEARELLRLAMTRLKLSARAHDKILKVSRTIADLAGSEEIKAEHLAEAIQYRSLDRELFV
jgi:magnesium chelatase family protein